MMFTTITTDAVLVVTLLCRFIILVFHNVCSASCVRLKERSVNTERIAHWMCGFLAVAIFVVLLRPPLGP